MRRGVCFFLVIGFFNVSASFAESNSSEDIVASSLKKLEARIQRFENKSDLSLLYSEEEAEGISLDDLNFVKSQVAAYGYPKKISIKANEKIVVLNDPFNSPVEINLSDILRHKIRINGRGFDLYSFSPETKVKDSLPLMLKELEKQQVLKYVLKTQEVSWLRLIVNVLFLPLTLSSCAAGDAYNSLKSTVSTWLTPSLSGQQMGDGKVAFPLAGPTGSQMRLTEQRYVQEGLSPSGYRLNGKGVGGHYSNSNSKSHDSYEDSMVTWRLGSRRGKSRPEYVPMGATVE